MRCKQTRRGLGNGILIFLPSCIPGVEGVAERERVQKRSKEADCEEARVMVVEMMYGYKSCY